ncbi:hypothetical protein MTO96_024822 [Rhipicephalus appendiculatus]
MRSRQDRHAIHTSEGHGRDLEMEAGGIVFVKTTRGEVLPLSKCVQPYRGAPSPDVATRISRPAEDVTPTHGTAGEARTSEFLVFPETGDAPVPPRATPVTPQATPAPAEARRYPMRNRRPPDRLQAGP